jgi:dihydrofolate synthase/folylpolyglutamate synthase
VPVAIVGVLGANRAGPLLTTLCRHAKEIYIVVLAQPRAMSHAELESCVPPNYQGRVTRATVAQLFPGGDACTAGAPDDVIVVTGSIYLLGEVLTQLAMRPSR